MLKISLHWSFYKAAPVLHCPSFLPTVQRCGSIIGYGFKQLLVVLPELKYLLALQRVRRPSLAKHQELVKQPYNDVDTGLSKRDIELKANLIDERRIM